MSATDSRIEIGSTAPVLFTIRDKDNLTLIMQDGKRLIVSAEPVPQDDGSVAGTSHLVATFFAPGAREGAASTLALGPDAEIQACRDALINKLSATVRESGASRRERTPRDHRRFTRSLGFGLVAAAMLLVLTPTIAATGYGQAIAGLKDALPCQAARLLHLPPSTECALSNTQPLAAITHGQATHSGLAENQNAWLKSPIGPAQAHEATPAKPLALAAAPRLHVTPAAHLTAAAFSRAEHDHWGIAAVPQAPEWDENGRVPLPLPGGGTMTKPGDFATFGLKF